MKKAFVTGGSGFVGRNLIESLVRDGIAVNALARSEAAQQAVASLGAQPVAGDLDAVSALQQGMQGCDVVFHAAAKVGEWGRWDDFVRINVTGTSNALTAARNAGVPRFVHVSTEALLVGGEPLRNADESWPYPPKPAGYYAASKGEAERLVLAANAPGFKTVSVRPRYIWGKGDTSVLPEVVAAVRAGKFAWIGGGRHLTSTCNVANVVEGMRLAAEKGTGGEAYFLTDGAPVEMRTFFTRLLATQGVDAGSRSVPHGVALALATGLELLWKLPGVPGQPPITRMAVKLLGEEVTVNDAKARRELGYIAKKSMEEGLLEMQTGR